MRIVQALAGAAEGGAERHFVRLCRAFKTAGIEQRVAIRPHAEALRSLSAAKLDTLSLRFGGPLDFATPRALKRLLQEFQPDLALTYMQRASAMMPRGPHLHVGRLGGYYDLKYFKRCHHLVTIAPDIKRHCMDAGWADRDVTVIPNFVDDHRGDAPAPRQALHTPQDAPLIFALGRLHENKAFDTLLRALALLPGVFLWLAGDGPERKPLEQLAIELGVGDRVAFLGWREETAAFFEAADVYVVPSRHEPLGSVTLEGWMHEKPTVAAASQGPRWLIEDEVTGLLVPIDAPEAMAVAVRRMFEEPDLAPRLAAAGRRAYEQGFTEKVAVGRYQALFAELLQERTW